MKQSTVFTKESMMEFIDEFHELYKTKPINDNSGGMKSGHMFPSWFIIKKIKPKYIIESGVWKGLGTWFFEKASPESKIISIDPNPNNRTYTSKNVTYKTEDLTLHNWGEIDVENTLVFLDDHQNYLERIKFLKKIGFKKLIIEDNYPFNRGDCYSPKKIISKKRYLLDTSRGQNWYEPNEKDYQYFTENVFKYQELPPLFKDYKTRWGDDWSNENYETHEPLLTDHEKYKIFYEERRDYTWICYLEI